MKGRDAGLPGRLLARGDPELLEHARGDLRRAIACGESANGTLLFRGRRLHYKWSSFRGRSRLRHALRGALLRAEAPRLREFANLEWLRARGFGAPRPVAAGLVRRRGAPLFQFLFTEEVPDARTLRELLEAGPGELRIPALGRLGEEVGRLHALGFVHRDLFPRNLLVTGTAEAPAIHFLDAWRGGPRPGLRGPAYDLACLMLYGVELLSPVEERAFFEAYLAARERGGAPARTKHLLRACARERLRLRGRLARRARGALPRASWTPVLAAGPPDGSRAQR